MSIIHFVDIKLIFSPWLLLKVGHYLEAIWPAGLVEKFESVVFSRWAHASLQRLPSGPPKSTASLLQMVLNLGSFEEIVRQLRVGELFFSFGKYANIDVVNTNLWKVGQELHELSSNTGNKDGASSTTFIDHITIPVFLELDFIGFAMLLLERKFWVFALVRSFTVLGAYWVVFRSFPLDWHVPIPGTPIGNSLHSLVLLVRELIKIFSVYTKGKTVDFHNRRLIPETFEEKFPQFLPCATDYWLISILTNFVEHGSSGDNPFQQCCTSASSFVKCV